MRLQRIAIRNFRGVDSSEVTLRTDGVTIIEGDNETGKTSLADAAVLIFEHRDSSTHKEIRAAQPVGRDVGPEVAVDLTSGDYRVSYRKRWLRKPMTELTVHEPRREHHTGRAAHDRMNAIIDETVDRLLWQALHVGQGAVADAAGFDVPSLGRALDVASGADAAGDREDALWDRIEAERDRYWTATGQPKAPRPEMQRKVEAAVARVREVEAQIREVDDKVERMARLGAETVSLETRQAELEQGQEALATRVAAVAELRGAVASLTAERKAARAALDRWTQIAAARVELVRSVTRTEQRLTADREQAEAVRAAGERAAARQEAAESAAEAATQALAVAEAHHELAIGDEDHRRREIEVAQVRERCVRVEAEQRSLEAAERLLAAVTVDEAVVERISAAELEVIRAEAASGAGAATVTITGLGGAPIEVDGATRALRVGESEAVPLTTPVSITVPGVVTVEVEPGAEAQQRSAELAAARETLARLCAAAGVTDAEQARTAAAARAEALRVQRDATVRIRQDLRDLTPEALARKADNLARQVEEYLVERPALPPLPADHGEAQAAAARAEAGLKESKRTADQAAAALAAATTAAAGAAVETTRLTGQIEMLEATLAERVAELERARAELDDAAVHDGLGAARADAEQRAEALADAERRLAAAAPGELDVAVQEAKAAVDAGRRALDRNRREVENLRGELNAAGEQGLAQRLHDAETARQHLERERAALESRADAALLLFEVFGGRRTETRNRYAAPFQAAIERFGRLVFGPTLEVELAPDLRIARRTLDGVAVDFDQLSTGAREQLGMVARLACASIVAADGGAPVVFDDALGWTDPGRLAHMGEVIAAAGRDCQVIVLTCTPGRYRSVAGAAVVDLRPPPVTLFDLDAG